MPQILELLPYVQLVVGEVDIAPAQP